MSSHTLPDVVRDRVTALVQSIDQGLQADGHKVPKALAIDASFDAGYVEATLVRALLAHHADIVDVAGVDIVELGNGGREAVMIDEGIERRFRVRRATRAQRGGGLVLKVNSDSIMTAIAETVSQGQLDLFSPVAEEIAATVQQWVLMYRINPSTRSFYEMWAGRVVGLAGRKAPFRLLFDDLVELPLDGPLPKRFERQRDDDLPLDDWGEDEEGTGQSSAG